MNNSFLLLSTYTLHVMLYTYYNTFQYKHILEIFHAIKESHTQVTSKDILLLSY